MIPNGNNMLDIEAYILKRQSTTLKCSRTGINNRQCSLIDLFKLTTITCVLMYVAISPLSDFSKLLIWAYCPIVSAFVLPRSFVEFVDALLGITIGCSITLGIMEWLLSTPSTY